MGRKRKKKSLRQIARELGVSASYLSQIRHGKRPASEKVLSSVKQNGIISSASYGEVSELADEHDLGSCAERHGGSSPPFPTIVYNRGNLNQFPLYFMGLQ